ncbi:MAG: hypothetical protein ACE5E5_15440, partial [Phycisphaerae bacterium]
MRPAPDDPSTLSPHERLRELTAILANGKAFPGMSGWSQTASLAPVGLDDVITIKEAIPNGRVKKGEVR